MPVVHVHVQYPYTHHIVHAHESECIVCMYVHLHGLQCHWTDSSVDYQLLYIYMCMCMYLHYIRTCTCTAPSTSMDGWIVKCNFIHQSLIKIFNYSSCNDYTVQMYTKVAHLSAQPPGMILEMQIGHFCSLPPITLKPNPSAVCRGQYTTMKNMVYRGTPTSTQYNKYVTASCLCVHTVCILVKVVNHCIKKIPNFYINATLEQTKRVQTPQREGRAYILHSPQNVRLRGGIRV